MRAMKPAVLSLMVLALLMANTGCQTFSMTDEQFGRQQRGQPVDPEVGAVVSSAGTAAYWGAMLGAFAAGAKGR